MNKRAKGNRIEREFMQVLKNSGKFAEIWKPCHCRGNSDIFGLFDIMAIDERDFPNRTKIVFFQVKGNPSGYSKAKKEVGKFAWDYGLDCFVILRVKKGLWRVYNPFDKEFYVNDKFEEVDKK